MTNPPPTHDPANWDWSPRWSAAKYQRLWDAGVFTAEDQVELVDGYILIKESESPSHGESVGRVKAALATLPADWQFCRQQSIVFTDSHVEPDVVVVRHTPQPASTLSEKAIGLIIEVAGTTLLRDQRDKTRIYARANIPVYWIINLVDQRIEVYTQPSGPTDVPAYGAFQTFQPGDAVPLVLDGVTVGNVSATDLLP